MRPARLSAALIGLLLLVTPAGGSGAAVSEDMAKVEAAARREGEFVWYTTYPELEANAMLAAFRKKYPEIRTGLFRGTGAAVAQRFETEFRAGRHAVDLVSVASMAAVPRWLRQNMLAPMAVPELASYGDAAKDPAGMWVWGGVSAYGVMYNTGLVTEAEAPKSWLDLFDPKWKGKLAMVGPWESDTAREWAFFMETQLKVGDAARKIAAQQPLLASVHANAAQAVVSGERALTLMLDYEFVGQKARRAPVAFVYPREGTVITPRPFVLPAKAPHPNAGKLFLNWLLSAEGQRMMVEGIRYHSVRTGQASPPGLSRFSDLKGFQIDAAELAKVERELAARWRDAVAR